MTIRKIPCRDEACIIRIDDENNKMIAGQCFTDESNAKIATKLLRDYIIESEGHKPTIITDITV